MPGTVEYIYWSDRRIKAFLETKNIPTPTTVTKTLGISNIKWLPSYSRSSTFEGSLKPQLAKLVEGALGRDIANRFNYPERIKFAKGLGSIVFGEFVTWLVDTQGAQPAVMFTSCDYDEDDRGSVAVCLYGRLDNFPDYIQAAGPSPNSGWISSSAPAVFNFLRSQGEREDERLSQDELALEALKIAAQQGLSDDFSALGNMRPWERAYTYGDVEFAEWLARIYLDVDLTKSRATDRTRYHQFRRVLVGVPFWVRTPEPSAIRLYARAQRTIRGPKRRGYPLTSSSHVTASAEPPPPTSSPEPPNVNRSTVTPSGEAAKHQQMSLHEARPSTDIPINVYQKLRTGFISSEADQLVRRFCDDPGNRLAHLGDPFGQVFAWIWRQNQSEAMLVLADYLADIRSHPRAGEIVPPISFDEILRGLRPALPHDFSDYDAVVERARNEVKDFYGKDPYE